LLLDADPDDRRDIGDDTRAGERGVADIGIIV
jgi:hypothetical protein